MIFSLSLFLFPSLSSQNLILLVQMVTQLMKNSAAIIAFNNAICSPPSRPFTPPPPPFLSFCSYPITFFHCPFTSHTLTLTNSLSFSLHHLIESLSLSRANNFPPNSRTRRDSPSNVFARNFFGGRSSRRRRRRRKNQPIGRLLANASPSKCFCLTFTHFVWDVALK